MKDMQDKICVVTGANAGIGRVTAIELARRGAAVWLACRSEAKTRPVLDEIAALGGPTPGFIALDLGDLDSVRRATDEVRAKLDRIDVLVNNAGLAGQQGLSKSGFELSFGVNHVGHYLWTRRILDLVQVPDRARIVNVSSRAHLRAKGIDWEAIRQPTKTVTGMPEYEVSKLANVLFDKRLARDLAGTGVTTYSLHPGVVATDIWRRVPGPFRWLMKRFMITEAEGAKTTLHCATDPSVADASGEYYDECQARPANPVALDEALQDELWRRSAEWTGLD